MSECSWTLDHRTECFRTFEYFFSGLRGDLVQVRWPANRMDHIITDGQLRCKKLGENWWPAEILLFFFCPCRHWQTEWSERDREKKNPRVRTVPSAGDRCGCVYKYNAPGSMERNVFGSGHRARCNSRIKSHKAIRHLIFRTSQEKASALRGLIRWSLWFRSSGKWKLTEETCLKIVSIMLRL